MPWSRSVDRASSTSCQPFPQLIRPGQQVGAGAPGELVSLRVRPGLGRAPSPWKCTLASLSSRGEVSVGRYGWASPGRGTGGWLLQQPPRVVTRLQLCCASAGCGSRGAGSTAGLCTPASPPVPAARPLRARWCWGAKAPAPLHTELGRVLLHLPSERQRTLENTESLVK